MIHRQSNTKKQSRTFVLLLCLLAMGLRLFHAPVHLAQEEHFGSNGHPTSHAAEGDSHANHGHEHDDSHLPHSALDHANDFIAWRTPDRQESVDLSALLPGESWSPPVWRALAKAALPEPRPPKLRPRLASRPRGPPAAI